VIAPTWRGWTRSDDWDTYVDYLQATGIPAYPDDDRFLVELGTTVAPFEVIEPVG
jgi:hypothetical protein